MANTFKLIKAVNIGSGGQASIDFTSIPGTYTDLNLVFSLRTNYANLDDYAKLTINGVTTSQTLRNIYGNGNITGSNSDTLIYLPLNGNTSTSSAFGNGAFYMSSYSGGTNKSISGDAVFENNATTAIIYANSGLWSSTSVITSLSLAPLYGTLFQQHSNAYLYGINKS